MASDPAHRVRDQSAIAGDLAALHRKIASLILVSWDPEASSSIHDLQRRIESLEPHTVSSEVVGAEGVDSQALDALTTNLLELLADCDKLIALAVRHAELDGQRLKADSRRAMNLQLGTAGTFGFILVGLVLLAEREHRRNEREAARHARTLQDVNAELDAFCGRVAHDLLTPLTPILGSAQIIARGVDPAVA
jgi:signal transduction histidine kinase